jgi:hypothetical protein
MKEFSFFASRILSNPMKKKLAVIGASLAIASVTALGVAQSSSAQDLRSTQSRSNLFAQADSTQTVPAPGAVDPNTPVPSAPAPNTSGPNNAPASKAAPASDAKGAAIGPNSKAGNVPSQYGIVRSVSGDNVSVRMLDGSTKQVAVTGDQASSLSTLQPGSILGFDTDPSSGAVTKLQSAEVDKKVSGTVSSIDGDRVTVLSSTGESLTTPVSSATISRMGLVPGKELIVTTYKGTWATKLCCPQTPAPVSNVVPEPAPQPAGAPFVAPAPKPVQGLW